MLQEQLENYLCLFWYLGNCFNWQDSKLTTIYDHILSMEDETTDIRKPPNTLALALS